MAVSFSKNCTLLMYKWNKLDGLFELLFNQSRINGIKKMKTVNLKNETFLITQSSSNVYNCGGNTDNILWKYSKDELKVIFSVHFICKNVIITIRHVIDSHCFTIIIFSNMFHTLGYCEYIFDNNELS